jgi:hypothetical protein
LLRPAGVAGSGGVKLTGLFPGKNLLVLAKWHLARPWAGYGEPLNGQALRAAAIERLIGDFEPDVLVETGTFLGFTTAHLAGYGVPVITAEIDRTFHRRALRRLRALENVEALRMDSRSAIRTVRDADRFRRPLIYLDAHWEGLELPLAGELAEIVEAWSDAVVVIDDFLVPGGRYGHYVYAGEPLALSTLPATGGLGAYPAQPAEEETGARRGTLYLGLGERGRVAVQRAIEAGELRAATPAS